MTHGGLRYPEHRRPFDAFLIPELHRIQGDAVSTSRREFLAASAASAAAMLAALGWPGLSRAALRQAQEPVFTPIRRNAGVFTMRGGTIGYLASTDAVVVIDSQFPAESRVFLTGLNTRTGGGPVDILINTHHHGDHTGGNVSFRGVARRVVAHAKAVEHMRQPPGGQAPADQLFPDTTFTEDWSADVGDERVTVRHFGRAHTSGDAIITLERANVVHMGDLMFNQRHPVVDRAAGATIRNWMTVLERTVREHADDTIYIFGHARAGFPVAGNHSDLERFGDYFDALLAFVESQVRAGRSRDEVLAMRDPLAGFENFGPFGQPGPRDALTCAYEEVTES
ncbi:MAG TPA: MBL fold metallo-hydrolase [Longimicrobiales bacterium]